MSSVRFLYKGIIWLLVVPMAMVTSYAASPQPTWVTVLQTASPTPLQPKLRDTLVVAIEQDINTLDPAGALGTHTQRTMANVFESLVDTSSPDGSVQPWLAQSWTVSKDGKQYTFVLRKGVKFQDGTPFNAAAVKFSIDRSLQKDNAYYYGPYVFPSFFLASLKEVQVVNESTVRFVLNNPDSTFLPNITYPVSGIVSPTAVKKYGRDFPLHGAGTGAFQIVRWDKGIRFVLAANQSYWGGVPKIKTLIFKPVPEEASRLSQLKHGDVDVVAALNPQLLPEIKGDPHVKALISPGIHTWYVMLNTKQKPFSDVRVRQAVNYAIDRKAIVSKVLHGAGIPSTSFSFPGTWSYNSASEKYPYDPAKARKLLSDAGYAQGFSVKFILPDSGSGMIAPKEIATVLQAYLAQVGIRVTIQTMEWVTYLNFLHPNGLNTSSGVYDMAEMSWNSAAADPSDYANLYLMCDSAPDHPNGFNDGYYCDPKVSTLLAEANQTVDKGARAGLYKQAEVIVAEDAPWIFGFHSNNVIGVRYDVQGVVPYPNLNTLPFRGAYIGPAPSR